jgi:hypothetical protein
MTEDGLAVGRAGWSASMVGRGVRVGLGQGVVVYDMVCEPDDDQLDIIVRCQI